MKLAITRDWPGASGLAEDVRRYGAIIHSEAIKRIGHLYPPVVLDSEAIRNRPDLEPLKGKTLSVIAWLWARTIKSPNPAFTHVDVPLASTFLLSNKETKEVYVQPVIDGDSYRFEVRIGTPPAGAELGTQASGHGANFRCLISGTPISADYIRSEAQAGRMGQRLMAIVADAPRSRVYLSPQEESERIARTASPTWKPDVEFFQQALGFRVGNYGMSKWSDLFSPRQIVGLTTLSDLIGEVRDRIRIDAVAGGMEDDGKGVENGGRGALAYAETVSLYLAFAIDRCADFCNSLTRWVPGNQKVMNLFGKQTVSMTWGYPEAAILSDTVGGFVPATEYISDCIVKLTPAAPGYASQADAQTQTVSRLKVISTDPPYYDNSRIRRPF